MSGSCSDGEAIVTHYLYKKKKKLVEKSKKEIKEGCFEFKETTTVGF
jgi:hypothetical protein